MAALGIEIAAPPNQRNAEVGLALATHAAQKGHDAYVYLIDEGVRFIQGNADKLRLFTDSGGKLFICAYSCQRRGLPSSGIDDAVYCGLGILADIVKSCDRFLCFS